MNGKLSPEHRALIWLEAILATLVLVVVALATAAVVFVPQAVSSDTASFVYGGAIAYAGGRGAQAGRVFSRNGDKC